jgi:hypothetical protein
LNDRVRPGGENEMATFVFYLPPYNPDNLDDRWEVHGNNDEIAALEKYHEYLKRQERSKMVNRVTWAIREA